MLKPTHIVLATAILIRIVLLEFLNN